MDDERRNLSRIELDAQVRLWRGSGEELGQGDVVDINVNGVLIEGRFDVEIDEELELEVLARPGELVDNQEPMRAALKVVRVEADPPRLAGAFLHVDLP